VKTAVRIRLIIDNFGLIADRDPTTTPEKNGLVKKTVQSGDMDSGTIKLGRIKAFFLLVPGGTGQIKNIESSLRA